MISDERLKFLAELDKYPNPTEEILIARELLSRRQADRWILCSEKMPKVNVNVITYDEHYGDVCEGVWNGDYWENDVNGDDCSITHWMPKHLPEPPEVQP